MINLFRTDAPLTSFKGADVIIDYHINEAETDARHFAIAFRPSVSGSDRAEILGLLRAHGCVESNGKWLQPHGLDLNLTFGGMLEYAGLKVFQMNSWAEMSEPKSQNFADREMGVGAWSKAATSDMDDRGPAL